MTHPLKEDGSYFLSDTFECPRCSYRSVVKNGAQSYICLNCGFKRDLTSRILDEKLSSAGSLLLIVFALLLLFMFL